jgi:hypothetical protein
MPQVPAQKMLVQHGREVRGIITMTTPAMMQQVGRIRTTCQLMPFRHIVWLKT